MPTTTKMGIVYPASTDLVKDGATAMGTISTTVDNKTGLVLINSTSFSSVATQSINNVFSANYKSYRIILKINGDNAYGNTLIRMRASGTDNTAASYYSAFFYSRTNNATGSGSGSAATSFVLQAGLNGYQWMHVGLDMHNPFLAVPTVYSFNGAGNDATSGYGAMGGGLHDVNTSYDGFTLINNSGNLGSGYVSIYGYNN